MTGSFILCILLELLLHLVETFVLGLTLAEDGSEEQDMTESARKQKALIYTVAR